MNSVNEDPSLLIKISFHNYVVQLLTYTLMFQLVRVELI